MLIKRDIDEILLIFQNNNNVSVVLISQFHTVTDMKLIKSNEDVEFLKQGHPTYIRNIDKLEEELIFLAPDYHYYNISNKEHCFHDWTDVGFHFTKLVCRHCDKEKAPEN